MSRIKLWLRELGGWLIATVYILSGVRVRALKRWALGETILPIVAGLLPVTSLPGVIAKGQTTLRRNLFKGGFPLRENIGRILGAWVAVQVVDND